LRQSLSATISARAELERQLAAVDGRLRETALARQQSRLLAPVDGTVVETKLRYPGQVLQPGEVVATLAPKGQPLSVKVQLPSRDVAPLKPGQRAYLRVGSCPHTDFGVLAGRVQAIAADAVDGEYAVTITPSADQLRQGQRRCALRAGMDVDADLVIRRGTVMGLLLRKLRLLVPT
jgi:multidrug efflux pump subunit AcrA (membrane-fusion protein)